MVHWSIRGLPCSDCRELTRVLQQARARRWQVGWEVYVRTDKLSCLLVKSSFHTGNLAGLALAPILIQTVGWRGLFYVFGVLGLPLWYFWRKAVPDQTPRAESASKTSSLSPVEMMSKSATWAIIVANFVNHWGKQVSHLSLHPDIKVSLS